LTLEFLCYIKVYPHIYYSFMPFKIFEFKELIRGIHFLKTDKILDLGCGVGLQTLILGEKCDRVVGIDIDAPAISRAQSKAKAVRKRIQAEFLLTGLEQAGFEGNSFDKIFSICVLEHVADYRAVLKEAHRILKPGGQMIFSVDSLANVADAQVIEKHRQMCSVQQYFTAEELSSALREIGFRNLQIYPIFCSQYARKLFLHGLECGFLYGRLAAIATYIKLSYHERRNASGREGLFLVAKCVK